MRKLMLIPVFLIFLSAAPSARIGEVKSKSIERVHVDKLSNKLNQIDSLLNSRK